MGKLCAWCKNEEALPYERYEGCCGIHCRDLMECDKELAQGKARIRELEEALSKIIQTYPIDALGLTVDARMREIAREVLSEEGE